MGVAVVPVTSLATTLTLPSASSVNSRSIVTALKSSVPRSATAGVVGGAAALGPSFLVSSIVSRNVTSASGVGAASPPQWSKKV